jgi:thiol-disulfide isomerase/thioredoxin
MTVRRRSLLAAGGLGLALPGVAHQLRPWPAGRRAPALRLPVLDGGTWDLATQRGHAVVVNFWASWCEPCRDEMPSLALMAQRHASEGLRLVTVNHQEGDRPIRAFLDRLALDLPVLLDRDGLATREWTPRVFPSTVLIDAKGQPRQVVVGEVDWGTAEARRWVAELLSASR